VEKLEDRLCPSGGGGETVTLHVAYDAGRQVTLTGSLSNSLGPIANQTIDLGGVVNGTATTNSQGAYSVTLPVSSLGNVTAYSADGRSNTAQSTLVGGKPVISNFTAIPEGGGVWLLSGKVSGTPTSGEMVAFSGIAAVNGLSAHVSGNGAFSEYITVTPGQGGYVDAVATDWWGDESQVATTDLSA
jgi:hypothetical protein